MRLNGIILRFHDSLTVWYFQLTIDGNIRSPVISSSARWDKYPILRSHPYCKPIFITSSIIETSYLFPSFFTSFVRHFYLKSLHSFFVWYFMPHEKPSHRRHTLSDDVCDCRQREHFLNITMNVLCQGVSTYSFTLAGSIQWLRINFQFPEQMQQIKSTMWEINWQQLISTIEKWK